jgi:hypothetical protein
MEFLFETQATPAEKTAIQHSFNEWRKQNPLVVADSELKLVAGANKIANCTFNGAMNSISIKSIYEATGKIASSKNYSDPVAKKSVKKNTKK